MNTKSHLLTAGIAVLIGGLGLSAAESSGATAGASPAPPAGVKPYTLFMGTDVLVAQKKDLYRVRDVTGSSVVITVGGHPVFVPVDRGAFSFKLEAQLKLSSKAATLAKFHYERAYTVASDPLRKFAREQAAAGSLAQSEAAVYNSYSAQMAVNQARQLWGAPSATVDRFDTGAKTIARAEQNLAMAQAQTNRAFAAEAGSFNQTSTYANRLQRDLAQEQFDAVEVTFEVSAEQPLNRPYVVLLATFRDRDAPAGQVKQWMYARELSPIDQAARAVRFLQGGFPPGFELKELHVRLYNAGREVATNLSPNRVELSLDDAFQYVLLGHIATHKQDTVPAKPSLAVLPPDVQMLLDKEEGKQWLFIKVSKEGRITAAFLDEDCTQQLADARLVRGLADIRCLPALEKGRPVESVLRVKLADLPQAL